MSLPASDDPGNTRQIGPVPLAPSEAKIVRSAVRAVRGGNHEAFGQLVELFQARLFGLCLMVTRYRTGAEDVAQETFLRAFRNLHLYDEHRPFYPWLATIGFRLAQNWLKRNTRLRRREGAELVSCPDQSTSADPLDELIRDQTARQLWRSVEALPAGERSAVILYYRQELKVAEVAKVLGVTRGTVKTLLFRARRHLKDGLEASTPRLGGTRVNL